MKQMRKTLCVLLVLIMVLSLGPSVFAAPGKGGGNKPVKVVFDVTPEGADVRVWAKDAAGDADPIAPAADGSYSLAAGEYRYTVSADGFVTEEEALTVPQQKTAFMVTVTLEEAPAEEPAEEEPAEEPVEEPAEEPVEEAPAEEPVEEAPAEEPVEDPAEEPVEETEEEPDEEGEPAVLWKFVSALRGADAGRSIMDDYSPLRGIDNGWQIDAGKYEGNAHDNKIAGFDDSELTQVSENGFIRIQKNVIPTETENEFEVYLSIDTYSRKVATTTSITEMMSIEGNPDMLYTGGHGNGYPDKDLCNAEQGGPYDNTPTSGDGGGCLANKTQGSEMSIAGGHDKMRINVYYPDKDHLIASPVLTCEVPNSTVYFKIYRHNPNGTTTTQFICLQNILNNGGVISNADTGERVYPNDDGEYVFDVLLTEMAFQALLQTKVNEETSEETVDIGAGTGDNSNKVIDQLGEYMTFVENVACDGTATASGSTVTWTLDPKTNPGTTEAEVVEDSQTTQNPDGGSTTETVITTSWWNLNVAEYRYKVRLDVMKAGFVSGTAYNVNESAELDYVLGKIIKNADGTTTFEPLPDGEGTLYFPVPQVHGRVFYVYHSADCKVDKYPYTDTGVTLQDGDWMKGGSTTAAQINLVEQVKSGFLYGGYYKAYGKAGTAKDLAGARGLTYTAASFGAKGTVDDAGGTKYNPTTARAWDGSLAYEDVKGTELAPQPDNIYYLKEVPDGFIRPYVHFTYDNYDPEKPLKALYIITATDDTNYKSAGYLVPDSTEPTGGAKCLMLSIKKPDGTTDKTLTAKSVFFSKYDTVTRGYLYYVDRSDLIGQSSFTYTPCWTTPDGVLVEGLTTRTLKNITTKTALRASDE